MSILENRYVVTQKGALTTFTVEQRVVIIEYSKAFETFGMTAFTKMEQILQKVGVDIKEYPKEIFVDFPNRYQTMGEKTVYQFDKADYRSLLGKSSLYWFLSTLEQEIHFCIASEDWKLQMALEYTSLEEKEEVLDKIQEMFLSGEVAYVYLLDIETAFPQDKSIRFVTTVQGILQNKPICLSDVYLEREETTILLPEDFEVEIDGYSYYTDGWLEEATKHSVVRTKLDIKTILEKLGFTAPFVIWDRNENVLELQDYENRSFELEVWGNLCFIKLGEDTFWYTFQISTPGVSFYLDMIDPIVIYL